MVERNLAKVEVESSRLFSRSINLGLIFCDQLAVLFFNNLEEVVKIYQLDLMRCDDVLVKTGGL